MSIKLSRAEAEKLARVIDWVCFATQDTEASKKMLSDISMKLKLAIDQTEATRDVNIDIA